MSHKFSFLQVFAGNNFTFCQFFSAYTQTRKLKNNQADLRVSCVRRVEEENALLANCDKYVILICQILLLNKLWWHIAVIVRKALGFRCYEPTTDIFQNLSNKFALYFLWFQNKYLKKDVGFERTKNLLARQAKLICVFTE
ncbi:MAG: hypothetical protein AAFS12_03370 [Cyanobacteria bacterium J06632_19]